MKHRFHAVVLSCVLLGAASVHAATMSWTNAGGGTFATGTNWSGSNAPVAGDTAVFNLASVAGYTVDFNAAAASNEIQVFTDKVTFDLNGFIYDNANRVRLGYAAGNVAQLTILDGTLRSSTAGGAELLIGNVANSTGILTVGAGGYMHHQSSATVGVLGTGALLVQAGGTLRTNWSTVGMYAGATGSLTISGAGALWDAVNGPYIGSHTTGSVTVADGGRMVTTSTNDVTVGYNATGVGALTVSTGTSALPGVQAAGPLVIGRDGSGTLLADNNGFVQAQRFYMARGSASTSAATITGGAVVQANYQTNLGSDVHFGAAAGGTGTLLISNGGTLRAGAAASSEAIIGYGATSNITATVTGPGSLWQVNGNMTVGNTTGGRGHLTVADGAQVTAGTVNVRETGTLVLDGGTVSGHIYNYGSSISGHGALLYPGVFSNTGTLHASGGTLLVDRASGVSLTWTGAFIGADAGATLKFRESGTAVVIITDGLVSGAGTIAVGTSLTVNGSSTLSPGNSTGVLTIAGALTLGSTATSHFELGGTTPGTGHDQLAVSGTATLGGSQLSVELVDGFEPLKTDQLAIVTATTRSGTFNATPLLGPSNVLKSLRVSYLTPGSVILTDFDLFPLADIAVNPLGGGLFEFNASGSYDPDDGPAPGAGIDAFAWTINGDGSFAEADDMVFTRSLVPGVYAVTLLVQDDELNWSSLVSLNFTVPEPSSLLLLGLSGLALLRRPRRSTV